MSSIIFWFSLVVIPVITTYVWRFAKRQIFVSRVNKIPGPKQLPVVGTLYLVSSLQRHERFAKLTEITNQYDGIFRWWLGSVADVKVSKAEYVEKILSSTVHLQKAYFYKNLKEWLGNGLLLSYGEHWHRQRKIITPTFHFSILEGFCAVFYEKTEIMVERVKKFCDTGKSFDIYPYITRCALDIICETAMGTNVHAQKDEESEYVKSLYEFVELFVQRFIRVWLHYDFIFKRTDLGKRYKRCLTAMHNFTTKIIREKQEAYNVKKSKKQIADDNDDIGKKKRKALLDVLLESNENGNLMTDANIREEVDTFMFEGHDTTTAGICWSLFLIGLHSDVQDKIAEEQATIFGSSKEQATLEDLSKMKYLERVVKEAMRLYPPVPIFSRTLSEDLEIGGYTVPYGCNVGIHLYNLHRDERYFPDPEKFDPDRFLPENTVKWHPYAYVPFSAGPRNCIGQKFALNEEKCVISTFLRSYKIKTLDKREDVICVNELILRPKDGINVVIEKRD